MRFSSSASTTMGTSSMVAADSSRKRVEGLDEAVDAAELAGYSGAAGNPVDEVRADVLGDGREVVAIEGLDRCKVCEHVRVRVRHGGVPLSTVRAIVIRVWIRWRRLVPSQEGQVDVLPGQHRTSRGEGVQLHTEVLGTRGCRGGGAGAGCFGTSRSRHRRCRPCRRSPLRSAPPRSSSRVSGPGAPG